MNQLEEALVARLADERILALQDAGNDIRRQLKRPDAVALLGCLELPALRTEVNGRFYEQVPRKAHILRSLKTPEEVQTLRRIYGRGFILVSVYSPERDRIHALERRIAEDLGEGPQYEPPGQYHDASQHVVDRDQIQTEDEYGQNVRDTFPLGDVFIDARSPQRMEAEIQRFVELLFGQPFRTPTPEEQAMFLAEAAKLRSAALGRQVGASLMTPEGDIVSVGCNDVPKPFGGLYWEGDPDDARDFKTGTDVSEEMKAGTLEEVLKELDGIGILKLEEGGLPEDHSAAAEQLMDQLSRTRLTSLIEFFRTTHAEMEAILSAARRGIPISGATLCSTTFPCHECTRHIVTAGIERVLYIEPYPKSLGPELHKDAIAVDEPGQEDLVQFNPFVGVGPRVYQDLFTMRRRKTGIDVAEWIPGPDLQPVLGLHEPGFVLNEARELETFEEAFTALTGDAADQE